MTKEESFQNLLEQNDKQAYLHRIAFAKEYAKLKCTQFAQWLNDTNWGEKQTWGRHDPPSHPTNEQLYEIFLQETDNQFIEQQNKEQ